MALEILQNAASNLWVHLDNMLFGRPISMPALVRGCLAREGRKEGSVLLKTHSTHLVTVIWRRTYGEGPFR